MLKKIGIFFFTITILWGCNKDNLNETHIEVTPNDINLNVESGTVILFNITGTSNIQLTHFKIDYRVDGDYSNNMLDSAISTTNFNYTFEFLVPEYDTQTKAFITFTITDEKGISGIKVKTLQIQTDQLLVENAGYEIYSALSEKEDAFDLINKNPLFSSSKSDSASMSILDASVDSIHGNTLSREWYTNNETSFVRFNDFDYANATKSTLRNAYLSGTKRDFITNLQATDIILISFKHIDHFDYMAIKIIEIIDQDSTLFDRYIFNIKR